MGKMALLSSAASNLSPLALSLSERPSILFNRCPLRALKKKKKEDEEGGIALLSLRAFAAGIAVYT